MKEMTVKEMYTLEETIAKDLFEGVTYPWEVLPKISSFILELGASLPEEEYEIRKGCTDCIYRRSGDHRKGRRGKTLCVYPWKCDRRRRGSCRKFYRAEKCGPLQ